MAAVTAHAKITASTTLPETTRQELAKALTGAFDESKGKFTIDFEDVWRFLGYSTKGNALQKLKDRFLEGEDFIHKRERVGCQIGMKDFGGRPTDKYYLCAVAFEHFCMTAPGERGKLVRQFFICLKAEYYRTLEGLGKRRRQDIMDASHRFVATEQERLAKELDTTLSGTEKEVQRRLQKDEGGAAEVPCKYGRVDLLTDTEVVEVKAIGAWKHALGQALAYSGCFPDHSPRIHLFVDELDDAVDVTGKEPDKYFLSKNAFEHFAMSSPGDVGRKVRQFFLAIRDAYVSRAASAAAAPVQPPEAPRVDPWDQARCDGIAMFWQKSAAIKRYLEARRASKDVGWAFYSQVATLLNQAIVGFAESTKGFKESRGIPPSLTVPDMLDGYGQSVRATFEVAFEKYFNRPAAELALMSPAGVLKDLAQMRDTMQAYLRGVHMDDIKDRLLDVPEAKRRKKEYGELRKSNAIGPSQVAMKVLEGIQGQAARSLCT
ncbi:hypothetical protein KFL_004530140 [Klebsormidium nitens]|uniref:Uncharacterized protein n=1 Tax=Klebsormidium nitens TaxID=105231 RepID=A0A1Y1IGV1_KLENI|nr:hypothetical protein KFL_004530140 [Klebsormidium nitens]|eukprot:GAQ88709.1 hypothetical protein KFL_004530140 [Klebsormidium nitens]